MRPWKQIAYYKIITFLFWFFIGVTLHDFTHALYQVGGYKEILGLHGGYIGLAGIVILWLIVTEFQLKGVELYSFEALEKVSKGTLMVIGIACAKSGVEMLGNPETISYGIVLLLLALGFVGVFIILLERQVKR